MTFLTGDVVVYHASIVTGGHGLLKKFGPMVIGCVLRTTMSFFSNYPNLLASELLNCYLILAMSNHYCHYIY